MGPSSHFYRRLRELTAPNWALQEKHLGELIGGNSARWTKYTAFPILMRMDLLIDQLGGAPSLQFLGRHPTLHITSKSLPSPSFSETLTGLTILQIHEIISNPSISKSSAQASASSSRGRMDRLGSCNRFPLPFPHPAESCMRAFWCRAQFSPCIASHSLFPCSSIRQLHLPHLRPFCRSEVGAGQH